MTERVLSKALPSYSYEVTFGTGSLGINLQTTKSKKGAYVDTFFRPKDNSILPAEQCGYIKLGDLLLEINQQDVSQKSLREVPRLIEQAQRPITIKFERIVMDLEFLDVVQDPRKLPWYMHYIVERSDIEEANIEQAKLMLWLEVEQYLGSQASVPDGDYTDQAHRILRKFFRPDSKFSLILHVPSDVRAAMLTALALAEAEDHGIDVSESERCPSSQIYRDAQAWAADDLQDGSFKKFCSSRMCARMCGHLRNSPPFVKMTLRDVLKCDKKTIFLLIHLTHLKRHSVLHCYNLLKHRPEDDVEGGAGAIEDMLRVAMACVHILGLKQASHGIEDLHMLSRLTELLPSSVELSNHLSKSVSATWAASTRHATYLDRLQSAITTTIPPCDNLLVLARDSLKMNEIRECMRSLRIRIMRELCSEIMPTFLASSEFEVLLWELDSRRLFVASEEKKKKAASDTDGDDSMDSSLLLDTPETPPAGHDYDRDEVELVHTLLHGGRDKGGGEVMTTPQRQRRPSNPSPQNESLVVPDGAVQRLLRQADLPGHMTMHRAPLDMLEELSREQKEMEGGPVSLLLAFDTEGGNIVDNRSEKKRRRSLMVSREYPSHLRSVEDDDVSDEETHLAGRQEEEDVDVASVLFSDSPEKKQGDELDRKPENVTVKYIHPIGSNMAATKFNKNYLSLIPDSINNFLIPHGECVYDTPMPTKVFNFAVNMANNTLVYGACLLMYREVKVRIPVTSNSAVKQQKVSSLPNTPTTNHLDNEGVKRNVSTVPKTPSTTSRRPPQSKQHQGTSSFKSLANINGSPIENPEGVNNNLVTPLKSTGGMGNVSDWIGQVSLSSVKSSPFIDRFKGLALGSNPAGGSDKTTTVGTPMQNGRTSDFLNERSHRKHARGGVGGAGSDDMSSDLSSGIRPGGSSSTMKRNDATIHKVEDTYAKTKLLLEDAGGVEVVSAMKKNANTPVPDTIDVRGDFFTTPPPEICHPDPGIEDKKKRKDMGNSMLIAPTPNIPFGSKQLGFQSYSTRMASSSESSSSSREEMFVPMYAANGFCMLSPVPCVNALRQPLSMLGCNEERLKTVLESDCGGFSDLESSEDDFDYEYSDDSDSAGDVGGRLLPQLDCSADTTFLYEMNAKTRSLRALNCMETDRSLVNLRHLHAEMCLNVKLPSVLQHGGAQDYNAEMILRSLSPKNFVTILLAFLLEFKIAVVSSKVSALLVMGEMLKALISPLKWSHVYCPLLPKQFSNDLLQCPTPFFIGIQREFLDLPEIPPSVIIVDIDHNTCTVTEELSGALMAGKKLTKTLTSLLLPSLHCCDSISPSAVEKEPFVDNDMTTKITSSDCMVREVLRSCKLFVADLVVGLDECCTFGVDHDEAVVLFDEAMFIASRASRSEDSMFRYSAECDFLALFLRTQCFSLCVIGTILKKFGPDSRPPSRPSSPYISIPSPTLFPAHHLAGSNVPKIHLPTTPVERS